MNRLILKGETDAEQAEERFRAKKMLVEALVAARHKEVLATFGLPTDTFACPQIEILDPEPVDRADAVRRLKPVRVSGASVLRGR